MSPDWCWPHGAYAATYEQPDGCECCGDALCRGECEQDDDTTSGPQRTRDGGIDD